MGPKSNECRAAEFFEASRKSINPMSWKASGRDLAATPALIVLMSFRLVIPWQVALQQSLPPLRQPG